MYKSGRSMLKKKTFVSEIIQRIAPRIGAKVIIEPEYGYVGQITFKSGKKVLFRDRNFNINPLGSSEIARDKNYSNYFLKYFGYSVTLEQSFFNEKMNQRITPRRNIDDGYKYARKIGFPVIVKPNNLSQGALVTKVFNKKEYYSSAKVILSRVPVMLVQKYYEGKDYRIVVLDDEVISAYQRIPLFVIGDGKTSIKNLVTKKQKYFKSIGRDTSIDISDFRIANTLKRNGYDWQTKLKKNQKLYLLDNANLSSGGDAIDVTNIIHPDFKNLAISITKDMCLRMCGVDLMITNDISQPLESYVILEINSAPGLDNYASIGKKQKRIVDELYLKVLKALEI
jgi:D-alanine-D-alanine ligase-like ATP-grasp enzyme